MDTTRTGGGAPGAGLRVAMLLDVFPRPSNTFIIDQIGGAIARGCEVDIFARYPADPPARSEALERYRMADRLRHLPIPPGLAARLRVVAGALSEPRVWRPALARELARCARHGALTELITALSFLRAGPHDVVHCQFGTLGPLAAEMHRSGALRGRLVVAFRGADATRWLPRDPARFADTFRRATLLLPVSASLRDRLLEAGAPPERTVVHHSGIHLERFPFGERRPPRDGVVRTLFVGRLTDKKGVRYLLEALPLVQRRVPGVVLEIAGDGDLRDELEARARQLGLAGSVRFLGLLSADEVRAAMARAHLVAAPSVTAEDGDQEGIPNVLKEAMACGIPVLSTRHSGIPELVRDGESGLLVGERDAEALAAAWVELCERTERWPAMGRAGRRAVEAGFDAGRLADDLVALYHRALAAPPV